MKYLMVVIAALLLTACGPSNSSQSSGDDASVAAYLIRTVDEDAGVVCWRYINGGGVSCLPLADTKLGQR
jgi:hypothetical protein